MFARRPARLFATALIIITTAGAATSLAKQAAPDAQSNNAKQNAAQEQAIPSAKEVLANYIEARGGEEALRAITTLRRTGSVEDFQRQRAGKLTHLTGDEMRVFMSLEFPGEPVLAGCDGETRWRMDPTSGPMTFGPPDSATAANFDFYRDLNYSTHFPQITNEGRGDFEGVDCWRLRLVDLEGREMYEFFAVDTGLKAGEQRAVLLRDDNLRIHREIWQDWKESEGVKYPGRILTKVSTQDAPDRLTQIVAYDVIKANDVKPEEFAIPAEIQEFLGAAPNEAVDEELQRKIDAAQEAARQRREAQGHNHGQSAPNRQNPKR
ncbi:MAG: hypothetical protein VYC34_10140 [Planctomycetota bacterium]|nr:hypothetical protein [Planctomycetota bacterium]